MMVLGQAVGTAAAIAALDSVTPKTVDIKKVQKRLVAEGIYLGDEERLKELGIRRKYGIPKSCSTSNGLLQE
jgi:hypothetical protein